MKHLCFFTALLLSLLMVFGAAAEQLLLPAGLTVIEAGAFAGDEAITEVVCPEGLLSIGGHAFSACRQLRSVSVPSSVSRIGADAFSGSSYPLLVRTTAGSAAMAYAQQNNLDYQADTAYRALLIGQCQYQTAGKLYGTLNDVQSMQAVLAQFQDTGFTAAVRTDLTAAQITQEIASVFSAAQPQDVSLLFYAGHGDRGGLLVGTDGSTLTPEALKACLDQIPGRKILIVDACHSGGLIGRSAASDAQSFVNAFLSPFTIQTRSALAAQEYYVLTAAHSSEYSAEIVNGSKSYGIFTTMLAKGCGYDYLTGTSCSLYADANGDSVITLQEAYQYAKTASFTLNPYQTAQVWPSGCTWLGLLRK